MAVPFEIEVPAILTAETPNSSQNTDSGNEDKTSTWTVTELTRRIKALLETGLGVVILQGELSNFKQSAQEHLYFVIKDAQAQIRGVMFRQSAQRLKFRVEDGLEVIVKGSLSVYPPRGEYQLTITSMEPKGIGALQLAFEQLKKKLTEEGLFLPEHKQKIPFFPKRIGIITSPTGSVIHDMLNVLNRRFPGVHVILFPAAVQGTPAPAELMEGLRYFNEISPQSVDVIIIGRGGGSMEDLWAFNHEGLARTIFSSKIPVISAVGHETDFTIADFVSDLRAPTPSAAMELAVPVRRELELLLEDYSLRFERVMSRRMEELKQRLDLTTRILSNPETLIVQYLQRVDDLSSRLSSSFMSQRLLRFRRWQTASQKLKLLSPSKELHNQQQMLKQQEIRLIKALEAHLTKAQDQFHQQVQLLDSLSPLATLGRGYSIILDKKNKPVRSVSKLLPDELVTLKLSDGEAETRVLRTIPQKQQGATT
ncbi:MAG: exodeoxyribonuclease VII large subunit [SAR324 cluster bacterium]|nr:exodeoxyribonuclease VII large subunit [SAR324 cluster bacterium]